MNSSKDERTKIRLSPILHLIEDSRVMSFSSVPLTPRWVLKKIGLIFAWDFLMVYINQIIGSYPHLCVP